ncbi:MAG: prenyltransferase [Actinomycetota bacterium]|nr:prenyltransferase [Actinomycetota bacterium]
MFDPGGALLSARDIDATVDSILAVQQEDGCIPWFAGGSADPWDHIEAAMGLTVGGRYERARAAFRWLATMQRDDGAWANEYKDGIVRDHTLDANFSSYVATGLWHYWLATADGVFVSEMWPTVERAIDFTLDLQSESGAIMWARDVHGRPWPKGLLTSSSCIYLSLRCALGLADVMGRQRPDWELALEPLRSAIVNKPEEFAPKHRYSMDWYYPVLGGALDGPAALEHLQSRWGEFAVEGRGIRCVSDRPWVTSAETFEFVLALDVAGLSGKAEEMFTWVQHLRAEDGSYWTGATFPDGTVWPQEKPTWGAGAALLAADALARNSRTSGLFRGEGLPPAARISQAVPDPL